MKKILEKTITNKIIKALSAIPNCHVRKRLATAVTGGEPDITGTHVFELNSGLKIGVRIEIEVKRPGEKPRPLQELSMNRHKENGVICFWCDNLDDCLSIYNNYINKISNELNLYDL